jgi:DNA-binding NarL/FixJ family response regulator
MLLNSHRHRTGTASEEESPAAFVEAGSPRVLLVARDALVRNGLRLVLEECGVAIAGEASTGDEAVACVQECRPGVVLVDMEGSARPLEIVRRLTQAARAPTVLALGDAPGGSAIVEAVAAGAGGYLLKEASPAELAVAIRTAASGALVLPPSATALLRRSEGRRDVAPRLTAREREVLALIASGRDNGQIATELFISPGTAKSHVSHILRKLEAENRTAAAVQAARIGLV